MTDTERELRSLLAEGAGYLSTLTPAAAKLGLDMKAEMQPWLDDVFKVMGWPKHGHGGGSNP